MLVQSYYFHKQLSFASSNENICETTRTFAKMLRLFVLIDYSFTDVYDEYVCALLFAP